MRDIDLLIRAGFLYPLTGDLSIVRDAEVAVAGDRIVHAGAQMPAGT